MARIDNLTNFLTDVAIAIKQKTGNKEDIPAKDFDVEINNIQTIGTLQDKQLDIVVNGTYNILPDEGFNALKNVEVNVNVQAETEEQHMPLYMIDTDDGNLLCVNNYTKMLYIPYSLDVDGNFIVTQDDDDNAVYSINENYELEVTV